jgi:hypothetical protein
MFTLDQLQRVVAAVPGATCIPETANPARGGRQYFVLLPSGTTIWSDGEIHARNNNPKELYLALRAIFEEVERGPLRDVALLREGFKIMVEHAVPENNFNGSKAWISFGHAREMLDRRIRELGAK